MESDLATKSTRRYNSPKREAEAEATRRRILDAFRHQLVTEGRDTLSPTDAAKRAGCSVRTVHGHFPSQESRIEALARNLDAEIYAEPPIPPETADDLGDHYRLIHQAALGSELSAALLSQVGSEWREIRALRRAARLDAVRTVVEGLGAPKEATEKALAVLLALAGGEVAIAMRDQSGLDADKVPDAIAHTVELVVADLRRAAR